MSELMNAENRTPGFRRQLLTTVSAVGIAGRRYMARTKPGQKIPIDRPCGSNLADRWSMWAGRENNFPVAFLAPNSNAAVLKSPYAVSGAESAAVQLRRGRQAFHFSRKIPIGSFLPPFVRPLQQFQGCRSSNQWNPLLQISQRRSPAQRHIRGYRRFCGHDGPSSGKSHHSRLFRRQGCGAWNVRKGWFVHPESRRAFCAVCVQIDIRCSGRGRICM